jgi:DNA segregation ATPase FtsK/SpoIIIE, S-DNA-T family
MTEPLLISRQRTLLRELLERGAERLEAGPEIERAARGRKAAAQRQFDEAYQAAIIRFASEKEAADVSVKETREAITARYEAEAKSAEREVGAARTRILSRYEDAKAAAKAAYKETRWTTGALFEGKKTEAEDRFKEVQAQVAGQVKKLETLRDEAQVQLQAWKLPADLPNGPHPGTAKARKLPACLASAEKHLERLQNLRAPEWKGVRLVLATALVWLILLVPAALLGGHLLPETPILGWAVCVVSLSGVVLLTAGGLRAWLVALARRRSQRHWLALCQAVADSEPARMRILAHYNKKRLRQVADARRRHDHEARKAHRVYRGQRALLKHQRKEQLAEATDQFRRRRDDALKRYEEELRQAEETYRNRAAELQERFDNESREIHERRDRLVQRFESEREKATRELAENWEQTLANARATIEEARQETARLFPRWDASGWAEWSPPVTLPPTVPLGEYRVSLDQALNGQAKAEPTPSGLPDFSLPALCPFPEQCSLLFLTGEGGRPEAVEALQAMMFRLLTSVPPGKVRFTLMDPIGLGQSFAAFMQLADHEEALVGPRIWTEVAHVEQRLTDLTAHMENVIQKYLRNQFETIEQYNAHAGEVAEPFRVLVVANFPANFTPEAARRLVSIAQTGRRCGVHTLISVDTRLALPPGFDLTDLERGAVVLEWEEGRFLWRDPDFGPYPLRLEAPPPAAVGSSILEVVGKKAREAGKVEVPFEFIAPPPAQYWTGDTRTGITVPLGRSGATKRQALQLGKGTSQHVLVAGKTGSGKSTLLHALITNLCLLYSPDEVELYLIDFKKGVEFKTYAAHELPHARVVAVESEREFGLSVLQRLDAELKIRGEHFRDAGAQDLNGYRTTTGQTMPRVLLIVDEFQEFFTEDDRLAQEAAQLLDRLVRQGRAFGLHVLLGSQTLGGAYTLARSTIDQMAVRIALQCSEADAHLILSDDNSAARLLSRPGEAIYNDANGLVEGNNPFQVVWLPDTRRETYLESIHERARARGGLPQVPLVFEGNVAADAARNPLLAQLLYPSTWPPVPRAVNAWLGEAVAIKDPTAATFRPQTASNLLVVGQQDELALGMLATALVGLAAQLAPGSGTKFYALDGSPADAGYAGTLGRVAAALPHGVRVGGVRDVGTVVGEVAAEVQRRQAAPEGEMAAPVFLVIFGLQRFRDLRRQEEDFSFGRREEEKANPAQQLASVLKEGAVLGVHVLVWCDTVNNLTRSLDRQALREFEMRVAFQMSVADSSNLIDTPLAGKLGLHRALFHSEEQGRLEKFRPYGVPAEAWVEEVRGRLAARDAGQDGGAERAHQDEAVERPA